MPALPLPDPVDAPEVYAGTALRRAAAWVIDIGLVFLMALIALPFTLFTALFWFAGLMLLLGFAYRWLALSTLSATLGMRLFGIGIRDLGGRRLGPDAAFLHTLGYTVSVAIFPMQLISALLMVLSDRGQGLTDIVLGTAAVRTAYL